MRWSWPILLIALLVACSDSGSGVPSGADTGASDLGADTSPPGDTAERDSSIETSQDTGPPGFDLGADSQPPLDVQSEPAPDDGTSQDAPTADTPDADPTETGADASADGSADGSTDADAALLLCSLCHGDRESSAPPRSMTGELPTTVRGVGAHRAHLRTSTTHRDVQCEDCHVVPTEIPAPGHIDTPLPAELTWGAIANADGALPSFDGTRCANVYCHGATLLPGGTNTSPRWALADGAPEAACGTCHGAPPGGTHPTGTACETCHGEVIGPGRVFTNPRLHINGRVEVRAGHPSGWSGPPHGRSVNTEGLAQCQECHGTALDGGSVRVSCAGSGCHSPTWQTDCVLCHGGVDNRTGAPPVGIRDETARTTLAVGAHTSHVQDTATHLAWGCARCHTNPTSALSSGHLDGDGRAEVVFDALNPGATYDLGTGRCAVSYCHGNGRASNGAIVWGTPATLTCASCHNDASTPRASWTMSGEHRQHVQGERIPCYECHNTVVNSANRIVNLGLHVNGLREVSLARGGTYTATGRLSCRPACHGNETWN